MKITVERSSRDSDLNPQAHTILTRITMALVPAIVWL
jgi:hypothetical protein